MSVRVHFPCGEMGAQWCGHLWLAWAQETCISSVVLTAQERLLVEPEGLGWLKGFLSISEEPSVFPYRRGQGAWDTVSLLSLQVSRGPCLSFIFCVSICSSHP